MLEKIRTGLWFLGRPTHWAHGWALSRRKFLPDHDTPAHVRQAGGWAAGKAVSIPEALRSIGLEGTLHALDPALMSEAQDRAARSAVQMGGPGDLPLLHTVTCLLRPQAIVETGVAYGWSSLAILSALEANQEGHLFSVDMPYPKMGNDAFVGIVVPDRFKARWTLVREPDRNGLSKAIDLAGGRIDLAVYDSDKSYYGRKFAFPLIWSALRPGGVFVSDDIQDNMGFAEFVEEKGVSFAVTESDGKFVGICRKP